ncbi:MAG: PilZ domain-containing protein [Myxococcota bacterium]|jgi:hypothetical protein|nr:PilZ domain-containing protein [Myxococcota bacterium]
MEDASLVQVESPDYRGACRRDFFRVSTWLPIRIRRLTSAAANELEHELDTPAEENGTVSDPVLEKRLCALEAKLDLLLRSTGHEIDEPVSKSPKRAVELSGSGLRAEVPGFLRRGDVVRVEVELPEERGRAIVILADVVSGNDGREMDTRTGVAVCFRSIRHRDREAIVRHAYEVQRLDLGKVSGRESLR